MNNARPINLEASWLTRLKDEFARPYWQAVNALWSVPLATREPNGELRISRAWITVVDGHGAMRSGGTHWLENLRRDPSACLWIAGVAHPLRVEIVVDEAQARRIASALRDKYGWQERWLMAVRPRSDREEPS